MPPSLFHVFAALAAYLLGSIPFGFLIARARGIDIRTVGSHNIGATNVFRTLGKGPGVLTFALDFLKGFCAAFLVPRLLHLAFGGEAAIGEMLVAGAFSMVGHTWPLFLGFKGGKGVATGAGMLFAIAPAPAAIALGTWIVVFVLTRYVSVGSIVAALALAALVWVPRFRPGEHPAIPLVISILALLVVVRHHANIGRLLKGTESRFSFSRGGK